MQNRDIYFMKSALEEAKKGAGFTSPNPMVGAVVVKNGTVVATGYHHRYGEDHAERDAISKLSAAHCLDATLYVTLEPCSHHGKTPPCADLIISSKFKKVYVATLDINPQVSGRGVARMRDAGIAVEVGLCEDEARELNKLFFFFHTKRRPYILLKAAVTLDGKIATQQGDSKWISNELCREKVHHIRKQVAAIAVGKNTVIHDRPQLNCRISGFERSPIDKIIFSDDTLNTECFGDNGGRIFYVNRKLSNDPVAFMAMCYEKGIDSILVEGGSSLYRYFLKYNLADAFLLFYRPSFLGNDGTPLILPDGVDTIAELDSWHVEKSELLNNNIMVYVTKRGDQCLPV